MIMFKIVSDELYAKDAGDHLVYDDLSGDPRGRSLATPSRSKPHCISWKYKKRLIELFL